MRCPVCGVENNEGRPFCAACEAELVPGAAAEIEPPRARDRRVRRLARTLAGRRRRAEARPEGRDGVDWIRLLRHAALVLAAVVPGLGHLILRRWRMAVCLWTAFAAGVLGWVLFVGLPAGTVMAGVAFGAVYASVLDISRMDPWTAGRRSVNLGHVLLALSLALGAHAGAFALVGLSWQQAALQEAVVRLGLPEAGSVEMAEAGVAFERGDHLLFRRRAYREAPPALGDIVLATARGITSLHRILAVPGDLLAVHGGWLYLNERPLPPRAYPLQAIQPHQANLVYPEWSRRLAEGEYAVWGDLTPHSVDVGPLVVQSWAIRGKAWRVFGPPAHRRLVNHREPTGRSVQDSERYYDHHRFPE